MRYKLGSGPEHSIGKKMPGRNAGTLVTRLGNSQ